MSIKQMKIKKSNKLEDVLENDDLSEESKNMKVVYASEEAAQKARELLDKMKALKGEKAK
jgi:hypothetical protein